jgi:hypothetical protein
MLVYKLQPTMTVLTLDISPWKHRAKEEQDGLAIE